MRRTLLFLLPLCFVLSVQSSAQEWVEVHSPNLRIIANSDTKLAQTALWHLEQVRTEFGLVLNRKKVSRNRPLLVMGLRNQPDFQTLAGGKPTLPGGFAVSGADNNYLVMDLSANDWSGAYRACALLLLNANYPRTQPWFDEGLAQVLAGMTVNDKQGDLRPPAEVARVLQGGTLVPVAQLISPNVQQSPEFRATSWLLFRWLQESNLLEASAQYFGQVMLQRVPPQQAFTQSFSISPADLDVALAKFRTTANTAKQIGVPAPLDKQTFASIKLPETDVKAYQAQFRLEVPGERARALKELQSLLAANHDSLEVNRGLAVAYLREGDLKSAADFTRRAIELKDDSAKMHYLLALYYNQGSNGPIQVDSAVPSILLQTDKAITLDPEFSDAYTLMAQAQLAMQRPDQAAKSVNRAMALRPRDENLLLTFASVQIANNKFTEAKSLLNFLKGSDDKGVAQRATEMLATADTARRTEHKWAEKAYVDPTEDRWKAPPKPASDQTTVADGEKKSDQPDTRKVEYLKGTLLSVQCADKRATLTVSSAKKTWTFSVADRSKALLIGADNFECGWKDVPVSINYKSSGALHGEIVSLEVD
jgi:tetratricopeptide (TPR) repeat protein